LTQKIKILIADAHLLIREGMKSLLAGNKDLVVVGEANGSSELPEKIKSLRPDVVIIDFTSLDIFIFMISIL